jgi:hypothetical protein
VSLHKITIRLLSFVLCREFVVCVFDTEPRPRNRRRVEETKALLTTEHSNQTVHRDPQCRPLDIILANLGRVVMKWFPMDVSRFLYLVVTTINTTQIPQFHKHTDHTNNHTIRNAKPSTCPACQSRSKKIIVVIWHIIWHPC